MNKHLKKLKVMDKQLEELAKSNGYMAACWLYEKYCNYIHFYVIVLNNIQLIIHSVVQMKGYLSSSHRAVGYVRQMLGATAVHDL